MLERETISLAFLAALQVLPPRQRAALILRDVLGFSTGEAARILQASEQSVASAVKRARATLTRELPAGQQESPPPPHSATEQQLVARLTRAWEAADVDGIVALLTDDAWLTMPPVPLEYQGRDLAARFLTLAFRRGRRHRLVATRANGQPAFGLYVRDPHTPVLHANGLLVLTLTGGFQWAFWVCGIIAALALPATAALFRRPVAATSPAATEAIRSAAAR